MVVIFFLLLADDVYHANADGCGSVVAMVTANLLLRESKYLFDLKPQYCIVDVYLIVCAHK